MASSQSRHPPPSVLPQFLSSLSLIFVLIIIIVHPSYGDHGDEPVRGKALAIEICNHTSDKKFCVDTLLKPGATPPSATASDISNAALRLAEGVAIDAQVLIASLLNDSSGSIRQQDRRLLQSCQLHNNKANTELALASNDMNSDSFDSLVDDLKNAANATKSCQDIIRGTRFSAILTEKNMDVIRLCEISVVSTKFLTIDDLT